MDGHLRNAPVGVLTVADDGTVAAANETAAALLGTDVAELPGQDVTRAMPSSTTGAIESAFDGTRVETDFEEYYPGIDRWLAVDVVPGEDRWAVYLRDRTGARERESELDRLRHRLDRTEEIDTLTARTLQTVIDADDRDAVARTVCEGLGTTDRYEFAWVGETDPAGEGLRVVASAGDAPDLADAIEAHLDDPHPGEPSETTHDGGDGESGDAGDATPALPEWRAVQSRSTTVTERLAAADAVPDAVRTAAFGRGLQSAVAVPLAHGETVFGVLGVYLSRESGLSDAERSSLETLGAVAGHAITANRREDLLFADTVTELSLRVADDSLPLSAAASAGEAPISVAGVVPRSPDADGDSPHDRAPEEYAADATGGTDPGGEAVVCYLQTVADPEQVVDALEGHDAAAAPRVVESEDGTRIQVSLTGRTPITVLAEWGGTVQVGEADVGECDLTVAVSSDVGTRSLVEAVDAVADEVTVESVTEATHSPRTAGGFRSDLEAALTDRQRTVLRTAYLSEYFASPRGSSAEDVADALDITGPTVLYHLRRAQRKLLDAFFAEDPDAVDP